MKKNRGRRRKEEVVRNFCKLFYFFDIFVLNNYACIIESVLSG